LDRARSQEVDRFAPFLVSSFQFLVSGSVGERG